MRFVQGIFIALLVSASVLTTRVGNAQSEIDRQSYELYQQVFSPFCPGRSLNDCPSAKAGELKAQMRAQLEQGVPPEVILEGVFQSFGEKYRAIPPYAGFGKLVWWVPIGFFVIGAALVLLASRRRSGGSDVKSTDRVTPTDPLIQAEIDRELSSIDDK